MVMTGRSALSPSIRANKEETMTSWKTYWYRVVRTIWAAAWMTIIFAGSEVCGQNLDVHPFEGKGGTIVRLRTGREDAIDSIKFNGNKIKFKGLAPSLFFTIPARVGTPERIEIIISIEFQD